MPYAKSCKQRIEDLLAQKHFEVQSADSAFSAGVLAERLKPQLIIWSLQTDGHNEIQIPANILDILNSRQSKIIALTTNEQQSKDLHNQGFQVCLADSFDDSRLAGLIGHSAGQAHR